MEVAKGFRSADPTVVAAYLAGVFDFRVFPSWRRTKKPRTVGWQAGASNDPAKILWWNRFYESPDFIICTGRDNNLWILDFDGPAGHARRCALEKKYCPLPQTWKTISGREEGGYHLWFRPTSTGPDLKSVAHALIDGERGKIDQKGRGGYAVQPASLHASGPRYQWAEGCAPGECEFASLPPEWLPILDWADELGEAVQSPRKCRVGERRGSSVKRTHDPASLLIGDAPGFGGFQDPIYKNAIRYFFDAGVDAPAEPIIAVLRELIVAAPKDHGRDVSRYLSGPDLPRIAERARTFTSEVKEKESDEYEYD